MVSSINQNVGLSRNNMESLKVQVQRDANARPAERTQENRTREDIIEERVERNQRNRENTPLGQRQPPIGRKIDITA